MWIALLVTAMLVGGFVSLHLKQDANWDLKNYHLYVPWAYLHHRLKIDLFAAGIQSYFPPLLDVPYYILAIHWLPNNPRTLAFIMGLPYGFLLYVAFWICWQVAGDYERVRVRRALLAFLALTFGGTGVSTISQVGTTFNEIPVAALTLSGLSAILMTYGESRKLRSRKHVALIVSFAGILFGAAAGLKLTACIYAPAGALLSFSRPDTWRHKLSFALLFCIGWLAAFLAIWGPWGFKLFELTGNPFFPLFNSIFRSPWIAPNGGIDARFFPKSFREALFYPFFWANSPNMTVMEPKFVDYRFAIVYALGLGALAISLVRRLVGWRGANTGSVTFALLVFAVTSFVIWEGMFSILRYAETLEVILGALLLAFLAIIFNRVHFNRFGVLSGLLVTALLCVALSTQYPVWGRVSYSKRVFAVDTQRVPTGSLVLLIGKPLAYVVPFIAPKSNNFKVIGLSGTTLGSNGFLLSRMVRDTIDHWRGRIYFVTRPETLRNAQILSRFHIFPSGHCLSINSNIDESFLMCRASRTNTGFPWPGVEKHGEYVLGSKLATNSEAYSLQSLGSGWSSPESWGTWSDAGVASVVLHSSKHLDSALKLSFCAHAFVTPVHRHLIIIVAVNGTILKKVAYDYPSGVNEVERSVPIPAALVAASSGTLNIRFKIQTPVSPASMGLSADPRLLGLGMVWLKVSAMK